MIDLDQCNVITVVLTVSTLQRVLGGVRIFIRDTTGC